MSTKALREALEWLENYLEHNPDAQEARRKALAELDAIETAAVDLTRLNLDDYVYEVRDTERVRTTTPPGKSTWEHPDVAAWGNAAQTLAAIARQKEESK